MDDDNDFQSPNFQLIGEENSRSPQALRSFTFPKFDIDDHDHLQVHLRFDSLAETEVFDIQSEESNWIEEFSSRSGAIGFSSAVAEPCPIPRHRNVWSEATSSESVEMLLNSVREDEMVNQNSEKREANIHAMDDNTDSRTIDCLDKSCKTVEPNEDFVVADQLQNMETPETSRGEKEDKEFDKCLVDEKLQSSEEVAADVLVVVDENLPSSLEVDEKLQPSVDTAAVISIIDGNLPSSLKVDVKECSAVVENIQVADKSLNFVSMTGIAQDDLVCDVKANNNPDPSTVMNTTDGPSEVSTGTSDVDTWKLSSDSVMEKHNEIGVHEKLELSDYNENLTKHFQTVDNIEGNDVKKHDCDSEVLKNPSSPETCVDPVSLLNEESSRGRFPQSSDGLLESIAYSTTDYKNKKRLHEERLISKEDSVPVLSNSDSERKSIDGIGGCSLQPCEQERSSMSSERHVKDDNQHKTLVINSLEMGNLGEEKDQTPMKALAGKKEQDLVISSSSFDELTSPACLQRTETNNAIDFDTFPRDSSRLESSVLQKNGDECTEDSTKTSDKSEVAEQTVKISSALSDGTENITPTGEKKVQMSDMVISLTDGSVAAEIPGKLLTPMKDYTGETVTPCNNVSSSDLSTASPSFGKVMDSLDKPNDRKSEGTSSSSAHSSKVFQKGCSDDVLQTDIKQKEVEISSLAKGQDEKDASISSASVASRILDSKMPSQLLAGPDSVVAGSAPKVLPDGTEDTVNSFADTSTESNLPRNEVDSDVLNPEGFKPGTSEPICGSPTIISSNDNSEKVEYQVGGGNLSDSSLPASEITSIGETKRPNDTKERRTSDDDGGFTFEVQPLVDISPKDTGCSWKPFSIPQPADQSQVSRENQNESKDGSKQTDIINIVEGDNINQAYGQANRKGGTPRGDGKEKVQQKRSRGKEKTPSSTPTFSDKNARRKSRTEDAKQYPFVESGSTQSPLTPTIQTSNLPDLNSSSSTVLLQQPFIDSQQIQLRAQIFVYGSLIQGLPPDEACMVSAFGGTDGGKSLWEGVWLTALERFQNQKSPLYQSDTPLHPRPVAEQGSSFSTHHTKALNSPSGWNGNKNMSSAALSSPISYTTPLWSVSSHDVVPSNIPRGTPLEFNKTVSPLHHSPSPAIRQYANTSTPWLPQSPRPSWVFAGSTADASAQYSPAPAFEAVKVTPSGSSVSRALNMQVATTTTSLSSQSALGVSAISNAPVETSKGKAIAKVESASQKSRKRKKLTTPEEFGPAFPTPVPVVEPALSAATKKLPTSTGFSPSVNTPITVTSSLYPSVTPHTAAPSHFQMVSCSDMQQRVVVSEEIGTNSEQSKLQAENASVNAASAVRHCQCIWDQLVNHRKSGLASDVKIKLVSAAAAAAAAASVAKAAAEAAKVASEAALQAKMMADEALSSVGTGSSNPNTEFVLDSGKSMTSSTIILAGKGKDSDKVQGSSLIISAVREAARKRVEAASAAAKRAENLDVIVKAAELAAEAVSHAGTIISMGDPLPFSVRELVEAGPEGYWKLHRQSSGTDAGTNNARVDENTSLDDGDHNGLIKQFFEHTSSHPKRRVLTNAGNEPRNASKLGSSIKKGSLVEVAANEEGLRGVWFSAWVLDIKEDKAYVCYKDLLDEGHGQLKEWIPLDYDNKTIPRIRNAHPSTLARSEGTRKRRRDDVVYYEWAVGDKVDAWLREGWWEGIVMEKCEGDETKLTVHFPAGGETMEVRAWNLRASLIWRDGQWIEWSRSREQPYEGDTPNEKRQKNGRFESTINIEKGEMNSFADESGKLEESELNFSDNDTIYAIGKSLRYDSNPIKEKRIGLQKEGSRVVFGIPKPGKKRKFMEVSKHYTTDKTNKVIEGSETMKFTQYLMPQSSSFQKNTSKVDGKGKQTFEFKAKGLKSSRSQNDRAKSTSERENSESSRGSQNPQKLSSNEEKTLEKSSLIHGDVPEKSEFAVIGSSARSVPQFQLSKNKTPGTVETETGDAGNVLSSVGKSSRSNVQVSENPVKASSDASEPRRSNRRIQPTSRLLEGLQSSLIISKIPSAPHDKGNRTSHRGPASSRGHNRG